jgi:hypothetical protein
MLFCGCFGTTARSIVIGIICNNLFLSGLVLYDSLASNLFDTSHSQTLSLNIVVAVEAVSDYVANVI